MSLCTRTGRRPHAALRAALVAWSCCAGLACAADTPALTLATPDAVRFEAEVYPVLLRDCAFHACHGSSERFLQVFGPGRGRLDPLTQPLDPALPVEVSYSYERARSMIDTQHPEQSLLLNKPLSIEAGGASHEGADDLGRNVYQDTSEYGYAVLDAWVFGTPAPVAPAPQP